MMKSKLKCDCCGRFVKVNELYQILIPSFTLEADVCPKCIKLPLCALFEKLKKNEVQNEKENR